MKRSFTQAMTAVHTWGGLVFGWVLSVVFVTGSIAVFANALSIWMEDIRTYPAPAGAPASNIQFTAHALDHLARAGSQADHWYVDFPAPGSSMGSIYYEMPDHSGDGFSFDSATGTPAPRAEGHQMRETNGGYNFVTMHFELHGGMAGLWLVGASTIVMLVALVTGIVIHKRIFKDFFTLRWSKGQRSWLDAHNVASVITLPFQIMIAYTGLAIFHYAYMPAGVAAHYELPGGVEGTFDGTGPYFQELYDNGGGGHAERTQTGAPMAPVEPMIAQAEAAWGDTYGFRIDLPGDPRAELTIFARTPEAEEHTRIRWIEAPYLTFNAVTGELLKSGGGKPPGPALDTMNAMSALHQLGYGGWPMRWLYFACGLAGCAMIVTGLILFTVKRKNRSENEFGPATPAVYRTIEKFNVVFVTGITVASAASFWINRLIPAAQEGRALLEIHLFLIVWGLTAVHAFLRPARKAWVEQLALASVLCLAITPLNAITTGDHLFAQLARADWILAIVEITVFLFGLAFAWLAWRVAQPAKPPARKSKLAPKTEAAA